MPSSLAARELGAARLQAVDPGSRPILHHVHGSLAMAVLDGFQLVVREADRAHQARLGELRHRAPGPLERHTAPSGECDRARGGASWRGRQRAPRRGGIPAHSLGATLLATAASRRSGRARRRSARWSCQVVLGRVEPIDSGCERRRDDRDAASRPGASRAEVRASKPPADTRDRNAATTELGAIRWSPLDAGLVARRRAGGPERVGVCVGGERLPAALLSRAAGRRTRPSETLSRGLLEPASPRSAAVARPARARERMPRERGLDRAIRALELHESRGRLDRGEARGARPRARSSGRTGAAVRDRREIAGWRSE